MKNLILTMLIAALFFTGIKAQTTTTAIKPDMVKVEGGSFYMGSNSGEEDEKPSHYVTVSSFSMCTHEVTVAEYKAFCQATSRPMPEAPSWGWNNKHPMVMVSWNDAVAYCNWLSDELNGDYRLPTEAEWEYAARGGKKNTSYIYAGSNDLDEVGWNQDNSGAQANSVMKKKPNELGLYDMSGNVWEWCRDWYEKEYYAKSPSTNPKGAATGSYRVLRGGGWYGPAAYCRVANRNYRTPDARFNDGGFRVVSPE
jgi:formylglycine-generating enzyme required for sulfatase activity